MNRRLEDQITSSTGKKIMRPLKLMSDIGVPPAMALMVGIGITGLDIISEYSDRMEENFEQITRAFYQYANKTDSRLTRLETLVAQNLHHQREVDK